MGREPTTSTQLAAVIAAEPEVGHDGRICVEAWRTLESTRPNTALTLGMGGSAMISGSIPWPEIRDWCEWKGLDRDATTIVAFVLRRLDADRAKREAARITALAK